MKSEVKRLNLTCHKLSNKFRSKRLDMLQVFGKSKIFIGHLNKLNKFLKSEIQKTNADLQLSKALTKSIKTTSIL